MSATSTSSLASRGVAASGRRGHGPHRRGSDPSVAIAHLRARAGRNIHDRRSHHRRGDRRGHGLDRRGDRRDADPRLALDQHQGAARLLDGAVQRRGRDALPGRAHPDPSRQLPRPRAAHHAALPDPGHPARATPSSATTPTRAAARTCPTSCSPSRSSSTASWSPGRSTSPTMPTSSIAATPTSTRRACASRRCGSIAAASCRRTCRT